MFSPRSSMTPPFSCAGSSPWSPVKALSDAFRLLKSSPCQGNPTISDGLDSFRLHISGQLGGCTIGFCRSVCLLTLLWYMPQIGKLKIPGGTRGEKFHEKGSALLRIRPLWRILWGQIWTVVCSTRATMNWTILNSVDQRTEEKSC